jgi:transcription antitermination factor NusG
MQALLVRYGGCDEGEGTSLGFNVGDDVVIREGPFADFVASVEAIDPERRVHLLIDFMGRHSRVTVQADKLSKP